MAKIRVILPALVGSRLVVGQKEKGTGLLQNSLERGKGLNMESGT